MSVSAGDNFSSHVAIVGYIIDARESLVDAERRLSDLLGRPMTNEEREQHAADHARAVELAKKHGPGYHGFGHPAPEPDD